MKASPARKSKCLSLLVFRMSGGRTCHSGSLVLTETCAYPCPAGCHFRSMSAATMRDFGTQKKKKTPSRTSRSRACHSSRFCIMCINGLAPDSSLPYRFVQPVRAAHCSPPTHRRCSFVSLVCTDHRSLSLSLSFKRARGKTYPALRPKDSRS